MSSIFSRSNKKANKISKEEEAKEEVLKELIPYIKAHFNPKHSKTDKVLNNARRFANGLNNCGGVACPECPLNNKIDSCLNLLVKSQAYIIYSKKFFNKKAAEEIFNRNFTYAGILYLRIYHTEYVQEEMEL